MTRDPKSFALPARVLHWLMALLVVAMLFIGVGMVASVSSRHAWLVGIHKPLGIAILILVVIRIAVRLRYPPPPLPADLPPLQKLAALASHWLLYALMLAMPLIGWAMLSAGGYPVMLGDSLRLPPIFPVSTTGFAVLRHAHTWLAMLLFVTFLAHMAAALYHGLIRRDGVLASMLGRAPSTSVDNHLLHPTNSGDNEAESASIDPGLNKPSTIAADPAAAEAALPPGADGASWPDDGAEQGFNDDDESAGNRPA